MLTVPCYTFVYAIGIYTVSIVSFDPVGINYVGQPGELKSCHNDAHNVCKYLIKAQGFRSDQILVLMDDGKHTEPTKSNIQDALVRMTQYSQPGDVVFVSFSGHGGQVVDTSGTYDCNNSILPWQLTRIRA
jgi:hypothetical protein